jgi:hypothetical protein
VTSARYHDAELAVLERLARMLLEQGRHGAARRILEGLVAVAPGRPGPHMLLAELHLGTGQPGPAAEHAAAALELAPHDEEAVALASLTQAAVGARDQAARLASRLAGGEHGAPAVRWARVMAARARGLARQRRQGEP